MMSRVVAVLTVLSCLVAAQRDPIESVSPTPADGRAPTNIPPTKSPVTRTTKAPTAAITPLTRSPTTARPTPADTAMPTSSPSSLPEATPFAANCPMPFRYKTTDTMLQNKAELRIQYAATQLEKGGWFLPVEVYIPSCFSPLSPSTLTFAVTCVETNTTMSLSDGNLMISETNSGWTSDLKLGGLATVNLKIVATGLNGVPSVPLMVLLKSRSLSSARFTATKFGTRTFRAPVNDYYTWEVIFIPARWLVADASKEKCLKYNYRNGKVRGDVGCCVASPGLDVLVCDQRQRNGPGNTVVMQVQVKITDPGTHTLCLGQPAVKDLPTDQCATITVPGQVYFQPIPVQYVIRNDDSTWSLVLPVHTHGRPTAPGKFDVYFDSTEVVATFVDETDVGYVLRVTPVLNDDNEIIASNNKITVSLVGQAGAGTSSKVSAGIQVDIVLLG